MGICQCRSRSFYTSRPQNVVSNLTLSLDRSMFWESKASFLLSILQSSCSSSSSSSCDSVSPVSLGSQALHEGQQLESTISDVLRSQRPPTQLTKELSRQMEAGSHREAPQAFGPQASIVFAKAAAEQAQSQIIRPDPLPPFQLSSMLVTPSLLHSIPSMLDHSNVVLPGPGVGQTDAMIQTTRNGLAAKYLFIENAISKFVRSAEHCYKLKTRRDGLKKAKTGNAEQSRTNEFDKISRVLNLSLANFDRAKATVEWLCNDYELVLVLERVQSQIRSSVRAREAVAHARPSSSAESLSYLLDQLDSSLENLSRRARDLHSAIRVHESFALTLGLHYLDQGEVEIEPSDVPSISAQTWAIMDVKRRNKVGPPELQEALIRGGQRLQALEKAKAQLDERFEMERRKSGSIGVQLDSLQIEHSEAVAKELAMVSTEVQELNRVFLNAFVSHVFEHLSERAVVAPPAPLDLHTLVDSLRKAEQEEIRDPIVKAEKKEDRKEWEKELSLDSVKEP